jgi:hypothetical protein
MEEPRGNPAVVSEHEHQYKCMTKGRILELVATRQQFDLSAKS